MIIVVNIMTLCYKVIKQAVLQSQYLSYYEVAGPTTGMSPGRGHDILKFHGVTPHHYVKI